MAWQADDTDVVAEVFAAELRTDAHVLGHLVDLFFHLDIAEGAAGGVTFGRSSS